MKNLYLGIITIVTVLCIIFGSVFYFFGFNDKIGTETTDEDLEAFEDIKIKADAIDLEICEGDDYSISFKVSKKIKYEYSVEDGVLEVKQKNKVKWWGSNTKCECVITVPSDAELEDLSIDSGIADVDIYDVDFKQAEAEVDVGDIKITNCNMTNLDLTADLGDIEITRCDMVNLNLQADMGDITVETDMDLDNYKMDLDVDLGEININGDKYSNKYTQKGDEGSLVMSCDMGNIEINK